LVRSPGPEAEEMEVQIRGDRGWYARGCVFEHIRDFVVM
jgi:hypothetical protein